MELNRSCITSRPSRKEYLSTWRKRRAGVEVDNLAPAAKQFAVPSEAVLQELGTLDDNFSFDPVTCMLVPIAVSNSLDYDNNPVDNFTDVSEANLQSNKVSCTNYTCPDTLYDVVDNCDEDFYGIDWDVDPPDNTATSTQSSNESPVSINDAMYDGTLQEGRVEDAKLWTAPENHIDEPGQLLELKIPSTIGIDNANMDTKVDAACTKHEAMQARLQEIWNDGKPWTERQKKNMIDFCNEFCDVHLPSFHVIEGTPFHLRSQVLANGRYIYIGLEKGIRERLSSDVAFSRTLNKIVLQINIDGIPFANKARRHIWPILVKFSDFPPITVAIFDGDGKPKDLPAFINPFLDELSDLQDKGLKVGCENEERILPVSVQCWICDAPARSWLKNVKGHGGFNACDRCDMMFVRCCRRTVHDRFQARSASKRTDEGFENMAYYNRKERLTHQKGFTPLMQYDVGCVSQFTLDYMHCVCLGVVKRLLVLWMRSTDMLHLFTPLGRRGREKFEHLVKLLGSCMPKDFTRQEMRSTEDINYWKAKELRIFLLYTGPLILGQLFEDQPIIFSHFLYLHCAMRVMCHDDAAVRHAVLPQARKWVDYWVDRAITIYGPQFPVHNVHLITHLADDVDFFQSSLDDISAFPFENHLQIVKSFITPSTRNASISVARRLHSSDMVTRRDFMKYVGTVGTRTTNKNDTCFFTDDDRLAIVADLNLDGTFTCMMFNRADCDALYTKPCNSKDLHVWVLTDATAASMDTHISRSQLKRKAILTAIPDLPGRVAAVGVLHKLAQ